MRNTMLEEFYFCGWRCQWWFQEILHKGSKIRTYLMVEVTCKSSAYVTYYETGYRLVRNNILHLFLHEPFKASFLLAPLQYFLCEKATWLLFFRFFVCLEKFQNLFFRLWSSLAVKRSCERLRFLILWKCNDFKFWCFKFRFFFFILSEYYI